MKTGLLGIMFFVFLGFNLTMRSRDKKLLIRNKRTRYLLSYQGFCARNTSEDNFSLMLTTPFHFAFVNNSLYKVLIAGFRKLRYLYARALCLCKRLDKVSRRGLLLLHWGCPDACGLLAHQARQQCAMSSTVKICS